MSVPISPAAPDEVPGAASTRKMLDAICDSWSLQILTLSFWGAARFEDWRVRLGISRSVLHARLARLVDIGLLAVPGRSAGKAHPVYSLTPMGEDLFGLVIAVWAWEERWPGTPVGEPHIVHRACGKPLRMRYDCVHCREEITFRQAAHANVPQVGGGKIVRGSRNRRALDAGAASTPVRAADILGDRWSFLILGQIYQGVRRFDDIAVATGAATNILTDRLAQLRRTGVVERRALRDRADRFEYYATPAGEDLFPARLEMHLWGDRWLAQPEERFPACYHIPCGGLLTPEPTCSYCRRPLHSPDLRVGLPSLLGPDRAPA